MSKSDWHTKIAANRGAKWRKNMLAGRREAMLNPSLLRLIRIKKEVTQLEIAESLEVSESTYGAIERGKQLVKKDAALTIAKKLDEPVSRLFKREGKKFIAVIQKAAI